jgi:negative regulator of sigma E activity
VASTMRTIEDVAAGRLAPAAAKDSIRAISEAPLAPTWLFTLAAAAGAVALAVIFGVQHLSAAALIFVSAAPAPFCAAVWRGSAQTSSCNHSARRLLAGVIGALAVRYS